MGGGGGAAGGRGGGAGGGPRRGGGSRERVLPLVGEGEPVIDLADRAAAFIDSLGIGDAQELSVPTDTIGTLPGESRSLSLLWEEGLRGYGAR